jgi:hypothetical protein
MMGGALGLAVLVSLSASRTDEFLVSGDDRLTALTGGYHAAFLVGSLFAIAGAVIGGLLIRAEKPAAMHAEAEPAH